MNKHYHWSSITKNASKATSLESPALGESNANIAGGENNLAQQLDDLFREELAELSRLLGKDLRIRVTTSRKDQQCQQCGQVVKKGEVKYWLEDPHIIVTGSSGGGRVGVYCYDSRRCVLQDLKRDEDKEAAYQKEMRRARKW